MRNSRLRELYTRQWYWYLAALLCLGLSIYWLITFSSSHNRQDLIVGCITIGIGILAIWRSFQAPPQEPPDLERIA
jgi:hypothetical protein